jgi:hypothetical protein
MPDCNVREIISNCHVPFLSSYPLFYVDRWQKGKVWKGSDGRASAEDSVTLQSDGTEGSGQPSVTVGGGYHTTTSDARRSVQRLVTQFKPAHYSPSCCITDKEQYKMCRWNSHWTAIHLNTSFLNFQVPSNPWHACNTLFTYTQRASFFSFVSSESSSLPHSC